jgi:hypothetical protein
MHITPPPKPLAERFFDAIYQMSNLEDELDDAVLRRCGVDPEDPGNWPMKNIHYDPYDSSFEFTGIKSDWAPTPEQLRACGDLGLARCWMCYADGTESYADLVTGRLSERKPRAVPSGS